MRFFWLLTFVPTFLLGAIEIRTFDPILILNSIITTQTLPPHYRSTHDLKDREDDYSFSMSGLSDLMVSGSAQFSVEELRAMIQHTEGKGLIIFDLRKEPHGFINNFAVSWYVPKNWLNVNLGFDECVSDERRRLDEAMQEKDIIMHKIVEKSYGESYATAIKLPINAHHMSTEEALCHNLGVGYVRLCVTDHLRPGDDMVDLFIKAALTLPDETWAHFHCKAGKGRTTTFMALFDMMKNAKRLSLQDIVMRHWALGGTNLFATPPNTSWKYGHHTKRQEFLAKFYEYCKDQAPHFDTLWSEWNATHYRTYQEEVL